MHEKSFQAPAKLHEPVGEVEKFTSAYLLQIAQESCDY